jgi:hypothetical protein
MQDGADHDVIGLVRVENEMRLEAKAAISRRKLDNGLANAREVREKAEGPFQTRIIGVSLIGAEIRECKPVDVDKTGTGATRKAKARAGCV